MTRTAKMLLLVVAVAGALSACTEDGNFETSFNTSCDHGNRVYQNGGGGGYIAVVAQDPTCKQPEG